MGRELAGVIACIQEIEIACGLLEKKTGLRGLHAAAEIKTMSRSFLAAPSADGGRRIQEKIVETKAGARDEDPEDNAVTFPVLVDGVRTTLFALAEELREVLEDLEQA